MNQKIKRPYKRRKKFIKKKFQSYFILMFFVLALVFSILVNIGLYIILNTKIEENLYSAHISIKSSGEIIVPYLILANLIVIPVIIIAARQLIKFYVMRISGPLLKFQKTAERAAQGDLTLEIDLRKGDQLYEFRDKFNYMIDELKANIGAVKLAFDQVKKTEKELDELTDSDPQDIERIKHRADTLYQDTVRLDEKIKVFKY